MADITHLEAHRLLQLAADATLEPGDRLALEPHLAECPECRAYARSLEATQDILRSSMHRRWDPLKAGLSIDKIQKHSRRTSMFNKWTVTFGTLGVIAALVAAFTILVNGQPRAQIIPPADAPTLTQTIPPAATLDEGKTPTPPAKALVLSGELRGYQRDVRWSPDGKQVAFVFDEGTPGNSHLEIVNTDGSGLRQVAEAATDLLNWSEDGSKLFFCLGSPDLNVRKSELFSISTDGTGLTNISNRKTTQALQGSCDIVPSPDGKRLAFTTQVFGGGLYVMDLNGENLHALIPVNMGVYEFIWSPDGSEIVFTGQDGFNNSFASGLYRARSDGGEIMSGWSSMPLGGSRTSNAAFSPGGQKIAYVEPDLGSPYHYSIYVMDSIGTVPVRVVELAGPIIQIAWSPDGTQFAFAADLPGAEIYVANADGSNLRYYSYFKQMDLTPSWSPDGQQIAFISSNNGENGQVLLIDIQDLQPSP